MSKKLYKIRVDEKVSVWASCVVELECEEEPTAENFKELVEKYGVHDISDEDFDWAASDIEEWDTSNFEIEDVKDLTNKYETGRDTHNNSIFDIKQAMMDLETCLTSGIPISDDLYKVLSLRFTVAHYNKSGWCSAYNGHWNMLADEIASKPRHYGDITYTDEQNQQIDSTCKFLREIGNKYITNL